MVAIAAIALRAMWQATRAVAVLDRAVARVTTAAGMLPLPVPVDVGAARDPPRRNHAVQRVTCRWLPGPCRSSGPIARGSLAIAVLSIAEIALAALAPWPLKLVVDNVLGDHPLPEPLAASRGIGRRRQSCRAARHRRGRGPAGAGRQRSDPHDPHAAAGRDGPAHRLQPARRGCSRTCRPSRCGTTFWPGRPTRSTASTPTRTASTTSSSAASSRWRWRCSTSASCSSCSPTSTGRSRCSRSTVVPFLYLCLRYYSAHHDRPGRAGEGAGVHADRTGVRDSVLGRRGQELRPRTARAGAVLAIRRRDDGRAPQPHVAGVAVLRRGERDYAGRDGARAGRRRTARPRRQADGRRAAGRHRVSGRGLQPDFRDCPYDRLAAAGHGQRPAGPRDSCAGARDVSTLPMPSTRRVSGATCASKRSASPTTTTAACWRT